MSLPHESKPAPLSCEERISSAGKFVTRTGFGGAQACGTRSCRPHELAAAGDDVPWLRQVGVLQMRSVEEAAKILDDIAERFVGH